jgi:hypothetical protein
MDDGGFDINADKFQIRPLAADESARLHSVLDPVLHDVRVSGAIVPDVRDEAHEDLGGGVVSAWLGNRAGTGGMGIRVLVGLPLAEQVAGLAEQVQEWEVEELAAVGLPATWPQCPDHPNSHPLAPEARDGQALWACPRTGRRIAAIGGVD